MRQLLALLLFVAGSAVAQQAGIAGVVTDQTSGQPLAGVHIRMITGDFSDDSSGLNAVYGALSDRAGHFSVTGLKFGLFFVLAEKNGYVQIAEANSPLGVGMLGLKAGQQVDDLKIVMAARATISGRVVDDYGDPMESVSIRTEVPPPGRMQESIMGNRNVVTDDHGEFRLMVAPGKYFVAASSMNGQPMQILEDGLTATTYETTYYPSAKDKSGAATIPVGAGQDVGGIEIRMLRSAPSASPNGSSGYTISGMVTGVPDNGFANVQLRSGESSDHLNNMRGTMAGPDGKFSMGGCKPGYYSVSASYTNGKTPLRSRAVEFHLESDQSGIQLALAPGEDLNGTVEFVGGEGAIPTTAVRLEDALGYGGVEQPVAPVAKDGSFHFPNVLPAKYKVVLEPLPENAYVKEVALDGKRAGVLDFSQGVGRSQVKITVSRAGAHISGKILGKDGEPLTGMVEVFLTTDPKQMDEENGKRSSDGTYSFQAVAPGKYHLYALDVLQLISAFTSDGDESEIMKQFFDAAEVIEVKEGDRLQKDITAMAKLPEKK